MPRIVDHLNYDLSDAKGRSNRIRSQRKMLQRDQLGNRYNYAEEYVLEDPEKQG